MNKSWQQDVDENLKCGLIEILILLLLKSEDMYGYQIVQEISNRSNNMINIKEGSLYGPLYRLENKKYVSFKKEFVGKRRFRNYYHLEEAGRKYLDYALDAYHKLNDGTLLIEKWKVEKEDE